MVISLVDVLRVHYDDDDDDDDDERTNGAVFISAVIKTLNEAMGTVPRRCDSCYSNEQMLKLNVPGRRVDNGNWRDSCRRSAAVDNNIIPEHCRPSEMINRSHTIISDK